MPASIPCPSTEVLIVGSGPAGLAAAIALCQRGIGCTVVEARSPGIDKVCGEGLMPDSRESLAQLGVTLTSDDGYLFRGIRFQNASHGVDADFRHGSGIGVRRPHLHALLAEHARQAGAILLWNSRARLPEDACEDPATPVQSACYRTALVNGKTHPLSLVGRRRWPGLIRAQVGRIAVLIAGSATSHRHGRTDAYARPLARVAGEGYRFTRHLTSALSGAVACSYGGGPASAPPRSALRLAYARARRTGMTERYLGCFPARYIQTFRATLCGLGVMLAFASATLAQKPAPLLLYLDPSTTQIHWTLKTNVHIVHGTFKLKSGDVRIDPVSGVATGLILIDATSGESGESARDRRMHSAILESNRYPTIGFRPTHVEGRIDLIAGGLVTVAGVFSLHGQEHPLQIVIHLQPQKPGSQPPSTALTTQFTIPFVAWGLKDPSTFIFRTGKEVTLDINAIALSPPSPTSHRLPRLD